MPHENEAIGSKVNKLKGLLRLQLPGYFASIVVLIDRGYCHTGKV